MHDPFNEYLEKFCNEYGITKDEAKQMKIIEIIKESYENENRPRKK